MRTANIAVPSPATPSPTLRLPLPVMVAAFCLLWASAFAVAKLAIADCPPLIVLTARFLLAGVVIIGAAALFGVRLSLSRRELLLAARVRAHRVHVRAGPHPALFDQRLVLRLVGRPGNRVLSIADSSAAK